MLDAGPQEVFNSWGPWSINKYLYMSELYFQLQFVIIMIFYSLNASVWFLSFKDFEIFRKDLKSISGKESLKTQ